MLSSPSALKGYGTMTLTWNDTIRFCSVCALLMGGAMTANASMGSEDTPSSKKQGEYENQAQQSSDWQKVTGTIKKTKHAALRNHDQENLLVQLETRQGRRIVDLGNADTLEEFDLQKGDRITAWGTVKSIGNKKVFMARKLKVGGGQKLSINRPDLSPQYSGDQHMTRQGGAGQQQQQRQQTAGGQNTITGEVVVAGEVMEYERAGNWLTFDRDGFYIVEEPNGKQSHLIVAERIDPGFNVGDRIEAQVKQDGTVTSISRMSQQSSGRSGNGQAQHDKQAQNKRDEAGSGGEQQTARSAEEERD
jgi:hypothetical protein